MKCLAWRSAAAKCESCASFSERDGCAGFCGLASTTMVAAKATPAMNAATIAGRDILDKDFLGAISGLEVKKRRKK